VVVGIDSQFNYIKAGIAMLYLRDKDCLFVATNTDPSIPLGNGLNMPGTNLHDATFLLSMIYNY